VKKKYFAIQPNHVAPAGAHYTAERVKKLKCENETALTRAKNMEMRKHLIRRSEAFQDPLVGGLMTRELGRAHGHEQDAVVRTLSQGLQEQEILRSEEDMLAEIGFPMQSSSTIYIADFDYDSVTGSLFLRMHPTPLNQVTPNRLSSKYNSGQESMFLLDNGRMSSWLSSFPAFLFQPAKRKNCLALLWKYILNHHQSI
jgi:hypothetical protein